MQIEISFDLHRHDPDISYNPCVEMMDYIENWVRQYKPDEYQYIVSTPRSSTVVISRLRLQTAIAVVLSEILHYYITGF